MSRTLGSLLIELHLSPEKFNADLLRAQERAEKAGRAMERSLNSPKSAQAANQYRATAAVLGKPLKTVVDDRALTELNKHLTLKQKHWAQVRRDFEKPIKPAVMRTQYVNDPQGGGAGGYGSRSGPGSAFDEKGLAKIIEKSISSGFRQAGKTSNLTDLITAPFRGIGSALSSIFTGVTEGLGREISREVGRGLSEGIQDQLAPLFGDLADFGRLLGDGLADEFLNLLRDEIPLIQSILKDLIGEKEIAVGSANIRANRRAASSGRVQTAQDQLAVETEELDKGRSQAKAEIAIAKKRRDLLAKIDSDLAKKIQKDFEKLGGKRLEKKAEEVLAQITKLREEMIELAGTAGETTPTPLPEDATLEQKKAAFEEQKKRRIANARIAARMSNKAAQMKSLKTRSEALTSDIDSTMKKARERYQKEIDDITIKDEELTKNERSMERRMRPYDDQAIVGRSKSRDQEIARAKQAAQKQARQKNLPELYKRIAGEVAKISGIQLAPGELPGLESFESLGIERKLGGEYEPAKNMIRVGQGLLDRLHSNMATLEEIEVITHEFRHAIQFGFGNKSKAIPRGDLITGTSDEIKKLAEYIELSTEQPGASGATSGRIRRLEEDAYVFALRHSERIKKAAERGAAVEVFEESVGIGGGKARRVMSNKIYEGNYRVDAFAKLSRVDASEELMVAKRRIEAAREKIDRVIEEFGDIQLLDADGIVEAQKRISDQLAESIAEIDEAADGFKADLLSKPQRMKDRTAEALRTHSTGKVVRPLAQELGIDVRGKSKGELIEAITSQGDLQRAYDRTMQITRERAQQRVQRQAQRVAAAEAAGRGARAIVEGGRSVIQVASDAVAAPQSRAIVAQMQAGLTNVAGRISQSAPAQAMLQGGRSALALTGQTARMGYRALQGAESLALDMLPMGRTAKAVGQQFILPAAGYVATTHLLPGGEMAAGALHDAIGSGISPIMNAIGGNSAVTAGQMIGGGLPAFGGIQQAVVSGVTDVVTQAFSGAASGLTELVSLAVGGRLVATGAGRAMGSAANVVNNALPNLLPRSSATTALPPSAVRPLLSAAGGVGRGAIEAELVEIQETARTSARTMAASIDVVSSAIEDIGALIARAADDFEDEAGDSVAEAVSTTRQQVRQDQRPRSQARTFDAGVAESTAIVSIDALIGDRAQKAAKEVWALHRRLKAEIKSGNMVKARTLFDQITSVSESALTDISKQAQSLSEQGLIGKAENSRVNGAKGQVVRAANVARAAMEKAQRAQDRMRSATDEDAALSSFSNLDEPQYRPATGSTLRSTRKLKVRAAQSSGADFTLASFTGIDEAIRDRVRQFVAKVQVARSTRVEDGVTENLRDSFREYTASERVLRRSRRSQARYDRAVNQVERRADTPLDAGGLEFGGAESFVGRVKRIFSASGVVDRVKDSIGGVIERLRSIPGVASLGLSSLLGFSAAAVIIPVLTGISKASSEAALEMERVERTINTGTGSQYRGRAAIADISKQADTLGINKQLALQGYSQFAGSTLGTALEGDTGLQIYKNVSQAVGAQGLGREKQERIFTAISQISSKSVVSMEELRQQLGDSLPSALSIAARSMGMTTSEFSKMVERGEVLSDDFLPKFAQQLAAESSSSVAGAASSAQASLTRLENKVFDLQVAFGKMILPAQKMGADVLVASMDKLILILEAGRKALTGFLLLTGSKALWGMAGGLAKAAATAILFHGALDKIVGFLAKMVAGAAVFIAKFLLFSAVIDIFQTFIKLADTSNSKFHEFAKTSTDSMKAYTESLIEAKEAKEALLNLPTDEKDVKGRSVVEDTVIGSVGKFLFGSETATKALRSAETGTLKALGMSTLAERDAAVRQDGQNALFAGSRTEVKLGVAQQLYGGNSELKQIVEIDRRLADIRAKKRGMSVLNPGDLAGIRALTKQEQELVAQREKSANSVGKLQQTVAESIALYEAGIKEIRQSAENGEITQEQYASKMVLAQAALEGARKDQDALNKALKDTTTTLEAFERAWAKIANGITDAATASKVLADRQRVAIGRRELAGGTRGSTERANELLQEEQLSATVERNRKALMEMRDLLSTFGAEKVKQTYGITDDTGVDALTTLSEAKGVTEKEKVILTRMAAAKQKEAELAASEADLVDAQTAADRRLEDLTKSIADFYRGVETQAKESALSAKSAALDLKSTNAKAKIVGALRGFQDNFMSEFADGLVSLIESFNEPFKIAIEAQQQILQNSTRLADTMRQGAEFQKFQLPNGQEGMGPGTIAGGQGPTQTAGGVRAIAANQVIGFTGSTGIGTGPHLDIRYERKYAQSAGKEKGGYRARPTDEHMARLSVGGKSLSQHKGSITSEYGPRRAPTAGASTFHEGVDFGFASGTPITTNVPIKSVRSYESGGGGGIVTEVIFTDGVALNLLHMHNKSLGVLDQNLKRTGVSGSATGQSAGRATFGSSSPGRGNGRTYTSADMPALFAGGSNSQIAKLVGMAEGNRTVTGGYTKAAYGHKDPGNGYWNMGSFSAQGDYNKGTIAASDKAVMERLLKPNLEKLFARAGQLGVAVTPKLMLNYIDSLNQGGVAVGTGWSDRKSKGLGFLGKLAMVKGRENDDAAIRELRMESYRNTRGRMEVAEVFRDPRDFARDQDRRMGKINVAMKAFGIDGGSAKPTPQGRRSAKPNPYVAPAGVMMPTTGVGVGRIAELESQAQDYSALDKKVQAAVATAGQTAMRDNMQIIESAAARSGLSRVETERKMRKLLRQSTVGMRNIEQNTTGLKDQFDDLISGIGPDTAQKGLRENLRKSQQSFRGYRQQIRDAIEETSSALADSRGLIEAFDSGELVVPPEVRQSVAEKIPKLEKQLQTLYSTRSEVTKAEEAVIADYRDKYLIDLKYREADARRGLTAEQLKAKSDEAALLRSQAEKPGIGPDRRDQFITRAASLDREVSQTQARTEYEQQMETAQRMRREQPDAYTAEDLVKRTKALDEQLQRKLKSADQVFENATAGIKQAANDRSLALTAESINRSVQEFQARAQSLEIQAKSLKGDPLRAIDLQIEAANTRYQGDVASKNLELSRQIEEQEKMVRASERSRDVADQVIAKLREQNDIDLGNLLSELSSVTEELTKQKVLTDAQMQARLREVQDQGQEFKIRRMYRSGQGLEAIQAQSAFDVGKIEFDLQAKLRDLSLDRTVSDEIRQKIKAELEANAALQTEEIQVNARIATEDNQARRRSLSTESEVSILNARASLAKSFGGDGTDYERQAAIISENQRFADSLRSIDEQARQLGLSAAEVTKLKTSAEQLRDINLKGIDAQFSPITEAIRGVSSAFQGFLGDVISGNESIGDAFSKMVSNVGNMLAQLAARLITQQLFSGLFGGLLGGGAGAAGGGGGGFLGGLFGFKDGGEIPAMDHRALRARPDSIGQALRREGPNSVLIATTPGEYVLTGQEKSAYLRFKRNQQMLGVSMPSQVTQQNEVINGYKNGGVVSPAPTVTQSINTAYSGNSSINIPITINNEGGDSERQDQSQTQARELKEQITALIIEQQRKSQRPRAIR